MIIINTTVLYTAPFFNCSIFSLGLFCMIFFFSTFAVQDFFSVISQLLPQKLNGPSLKKIRILLRVHRVFLEISSGSPLNAW